jgi:hypothetical protein
LEEIVVYVKKEQKQDGGQMRMRTLRIFFRIINDFVHRFIFDRTFVDFTVSLLILPFDIVDFKSKMVKSTVKP